MSHYSFEQTLRWVLKDELGDSRYMELCEQSATLNDHRWTGLSLPSDLFKAEKIRAAMKASNRAHLLLKQDGRTRRRGIDLAVCELRAWARQLGAIDVLKIVPDFEGPGWGAFNKVLTDKRLNLCTPKSERAARPEGPGHAQDHSSGGQIDVNRKRQHQATESQQPATSHQRSTLGPTLFTVAQIEAVLRGQIPAQVVDELAPSPT